MENTNIEKVPFNSELVAYYWVEHCMSGDQYWYDSIKFYKSLDDKFYKEYNEGYMNDTTVSEVTEEKVIAQMKEATVKQEKNIEPEAYRSYHNVYVEQEYVKSEHELKFNSMGIKKVGDCVYPIYPSDNSDSYELIRRALAQPEAEELKKLVEEKSVSDIKNSGLFTIENENNEIVLRVRDVVVPLSENEVEKCKKWVEWKEKNIVKGLVYSENNKGGVEAYMNGERCWLVAKYEPSENKLVIYGDLGDKFVDEVLPTIDFKDLTGKDLTGKDYVYEYIRQYALYVQNQKSLELDINPNDLTQVDETFYKVDVEGAALVEVMERASAQPNADWLTHQSGEFDKLIANDDFAYEVYASKTAEGVEMRFAALEQNIDVKVPLSDKEAQTLIKAIDTKEQAKEAEAAAKMNNVKKKETPVKE